LGIIRRTFKFFSIYTEPVKPVIEVPKYGQDIPLTDVDAVTMNVGDNVTAASNTTITIRCPVSGVPTPAVTWQKDGVQIIGGDKFSMTDDNSLVINDAEIKHSAKYSCITQNEFGKDEASSTVRIIGECCFLCINMCIRNKSECFKVEKFLLKIVFNSPHFSP